MMQVDNAAAFSPRIAEQTSDLTRRAIIGRSLGTGNIGPNVSAVGCYVGKENAAVTGRCWEADEGSSRNPRAVQGLY